MKAVAAPVVAEEGVAGVEEVSVVVSEAAPAAGVVVSVGVEASAGPCVVVTSVVSSDEDVVVGALLLEALG